MANSHILIPALARLLPDVFRERVFDPAFADLIVEEAGQGGTTPRFMPRYGQRILFILNCLRLGVPQLFWYRGRPTRLTGRVAAAFVVVFLVVVFIATRVSYPAVASG
jgi:hypothetical protein